MEQNLISDRNVQQEHPNTIILSHILGKYRNEQLKQTLHSVKSHTEFFPDNTSQPVLSSCTAKKFKPLHFKWFYARIFINAIQ